MTACEIKDCDISIHLSPTGVLHFEGSGLELIKRRFEEDWRWGFFMLAADKPSTKTCPTLAFWQEIAVHYLTKQCHAIHDIHTDSIQEVEGERLEAWISAAPPMQGGEYLTSTVLKNVWKALDSWVQETVQKSGSPEKFLVAYAPKWQQVGRVCFHLAENKKDPDLPFAFLATYATGMGEGGKVKHLPLKQALLLNSETGNKEALIKLLIPIHNASQKCPWIRELIDSAQIYQPLLWTVEKAYKFLSSVVDLEESGLQVRIPNWWKKRPRPQVSITINSSKTSTLGVDALLDFKMDVALGEEKLSEEELTQMLSTQGNLLRLRGQWVEVDAKKLEEALTHWKLVQKNVGGDGISFIEGMRLLAGAPMGLDAHNVNEEVNHWIKIAPGEELAALLKNLRDPESIPQKNLSKLQAVLRPYQEKGMSWLSFLTNLGLGACLADDMGLGKTIQILSLLLLQSRSKNPSLLVVPASLLGNWKREAEKFAPSLNMLLLHPSEKMVSAVPENIDCVVTTYSMISKLDWIKEKSWNLLILDEAQAIKNSETKQAQAIKTCKSHSRVALTGTPIENRLSDLWSLFDFLNPGLLGSAARFKQYVDGLEGGPRAFEPLRKLVGPYILRRMKTDPTIISDLPDKIETPVHCYLTKEQVVLYQNTVNGLKEILEAISPEARRGAVLKTLMELKQICNHPSQYTGDGTYAPLNSGKFERLKDICEELASRQEKVLIFTQFSEIIPALEEYLSSIFGKRGLVLHGKTPIKQRKSLVDSFQSENGSPFFILSLKAGGIGLTLTAASHVIHFDRWWNPAVENQATDRAFRIGQKKNVQVHKFITQGTIEEKIDAIIASKTSLANNILGMTNEIKLTELADDELVKLLTLDLERATIS